MLGRALAVLGIILAVATHAAADEAPISVVVTPFTTADADLSLYGKPVADAVARGLTTAARTGVSVRTGDDAAKADIVVQLRVTPHGRGKVQLQAAIAPDQDQPGGAATSSAVAIADLDRAAAEVATRLGPSLDATIVVVKKRKAEAAATKPEPKPEPKPAPEPVTPPADTRPLVVLTIVDAQPEGTLAVSDLATAEAAAFVDRLGFRAERAHETGLIEVGAAAKLAAHARVTLMLGVDSLTFERRGVLTAHARVRCVMIAPDGTALVDRTVATDTVVGGKHDGHDALARMAVREAMDILLPSVKKALR